MAWLDFLDQDLMPEEFLLEELCFGTLIILILILMTVFMLKRRKWSGYMKGFGGQLTDKERKGFEKRIKGSIMNNLSATVLAVVVLFVVFLITLAFVNSIIGRWVWAVFSLFIIVVLGIQLWMIFSLGKLKDIDEEEYGFLYEFVASVCDTFDIRKPQLKQDESPVMNAYTTSFFGRGSVIVITKGLLERVDIGRVSKDQLKAIVGHEMGHIVNHDATVITVLNPVMMFTLAVRSVFEILVRGIIFFMMAVGRFGTRGILSLLIAVGMIFLLAIVLFYVGVYYVIFYLLTMAVVIPWFLLSRQKEYAADLFGSLVSGSRTTMATSLMELLRESGFDEVKGKMAKRIIEERTGKDPGDDQAQEADGVPEKKAEEQPPAPEGPEQPAEQTADQASGQPSDEEMTEQTQEADGEPEKKAEEQPPTPEGPEQPGEQIADPVSGQLSEEEKMEIFMGIDVYKEFSEDPELISEVTMRDSRALIEKKGLERFEDEDFVEFAGFDYTFQEKMGELMLSHPLFGKRVKDLTLISLSGITGPGDEPEGDQGELPTSPPAT